MSSYIINNRVGLRVIIEIPVIVAIPHTSVHIINSIDVTEISQLL